MMASTRNKAIMGGVAALVLAGGLTAAAAQGMGHGWGGHGWGGHGGRMGGMMGERFCASTDPMAPRIAGKLEATLKPTDAQKADFETLRKAMGDAEGKLKAGCPTAAERADRTPPGRLAVAEKRMSAGLDALRTVRPAFDALYAKLDDKQRDSMRWMRPGPMFGEEGPGWRHGMGGSDDRGPGAPRPRG
jgi:hypothetical protein